MFLTVGAFCCRPGRHVVNELPIRPKAQKPATATTTAGAIEAIVAYEDAYVQPLIVSALKKVLPEGSYNLREDIPASSDEALKLSTVVPSAADTRILQITAYERLDFEHAAAHARTTLINSYMFRKALIRKHYLSATVDHWVAKNPASVLAAHVKRAEHFEVDYAEFLDDALVEAFDLRESMGANEGKAADERDWWILKPGMSDRGQGIRLFSTMEELQAIFDGWEEGRPDSDEEEEEGDDNEEGTGEGEGGGDYITTSHLRHFVAQPYIHPPLLVPGDDRKFHIRTYVLCTGSLTVHVYRHMLALSAAKPYAAPWQSPDDIESFLTNTCLQTSSSSGSTTATNTVRRFWSLPLPERTLSSVFEGICAVAGEVFEAAARAMPMHFQPLPNAFEVYGLDFLVGDDGATPWLLEVNAFPDFKQTGGDLSDLVGGFWEGVVKVAVAPFFGVGGKEETGTGGGGDDGDMVKVREVDLGRR